MNAHMQSSLSNLENKLNALIISLTTSPTAAGAPATASGLLEADDSLTTAVETLRQHQENYAKVLGLRAEAERLEGRVKSIVGDVETREKQIRAVCGDEESDSDSDLEDDSDYDSNNNEDVDMTNTAKPKTKMTKEVDYRILLDFARRISKYNHEAAADAAAGTLGSPKTKEKPQQAAPETDVSMTGVNGAMEVEEGAEPVSSVTKGATSWLDESANMTREMYMLPYPAEDRIRLGLMGQIQLAAAEGRPGFEIDNEVERLLREAEGRGVAEAIEPARVGDESRHAGEAAQAAAQAGSAAASGPASAPAPAPKPKATLDLDLYDPDDDEV